VFTFCGGGTRTNSRSKIVEEANGGKCPGDEYDDPTIMNENCNDDVYCPVDCQWSEWVATDCSATCGGGSRTKTRTKIVEEMYGGTCEGGSETVEDCSTHGCPAELNLADLCNTLGRCGPNFNCRCNRNLVYWAVYCNAATGWCGDTAEFRDAQTDDAYDWQPAGIVTCTDKHQSCPGWVNANSGYCNYSWFTADTGNYGCQKACGLC